MIADIPWDLERLKKTPQVEWLNRKGTVHSLLYEGEPFKGDCATQVFAYYASPGTLNANPELDRDLPAIVLVHGGGGTAFDQWARKWAADGYAAIAMDLNGGRPKGGNVFKQRSSYGPSKYIPCHGFLQRPTLVLSRGG